MCLLLSVWTDSVVGLERHQDHKTQSVFFNLFFFYSGFQFCFQSGLQIWCISDRNISCNTLLDNAIKDTYATEKLENSVHHEQNHLTVTAEGACQNVAFSWYFVAFFCLFVFCFTPARSARGLPTGLQVALHMQSLPTWVRNSAEICRWFRAVFYLTSICLTCRHPVNFLWHVLDQNCQSYLWNSHWFTQKRPRFLKLEFLKLECIATTTVTILYMVFLSCLLLYHYHQEISQCSEKTPLSPLYM